MAGLSCDCPHKRSFPFPTVCDSLLLLRIEGKKSDELSSFVSERPTAVTKLFGSRHNWVRPQREK